MKKVISLFVLVMLIVLGNAHAGITPALGQTTPDESWDAQFSPDGEWVAYSCVPQTDGQDREICVLELTSLSHQQITYTDGMLYAPSWSPDGRNILASGSLDGVQGLFVIDMATKGVSTLITAPINQQYEVGDWSPDGSQVAFNCRFGDRWQICMVDVQNPRLFRTFELVGSRINGCHSPVWASDNEIITACDNYILQINTITQEVDELVNNISCNDIDLQGDTLVCETRGQHSVMRTVNLITNAVADLRPGMFPSFSPDSEFIVYSLFHECNVELFLINSENTGEPLCLTCE